MTRPSWWAIVHTGTDGTVTLIGPWRDQANAEGWCSLLEAQHSDGDDEWRVLPVWRWQAFEETRR